MAEDVDHGPDVLHVIAAGPTGGAESVTRALTTAQARRGQKVALAVTRCQEDPVPALLEQVRAEGLDLWDVAVGHRRYLTELRGLRRTLRRVAPDVVHTHGYRADVLGYAAARMEDRPIVSTVHGFTGGGLKNRLFELLQLGVLRRFDGVAAVSRVLATQLGDRGIPAERVEVIPNAWSRNVRHLDREAARSTLGIERDVPVLGWVGRLSREKGLDVLVRAVPHLTESDPALAIVGDGPQRQQVQKLADELGVAHRLDWCGRVPDAAPLFRAFDLFVLSSRTEGTPMVVFEAMAAGVPVVATRVGGVPDQVSTRTGYLVPPEDPVALAQALDEALGSEAETFRRARAARERLKADFGADDWTDSYRALYDRALHRSAS